MGEQTSNKIAKVMEFDDAVYYRAMCACGSDDCGLTLELEYDHGLDDIVLTIYTKLTYCSWYGISPVDKFYWFKDMWQRIKGAFKLLSTGQIRLEESFLFNEAKQIDDFITAIQEGKEKMQNAAKKSDNS